MTGPRKIAPRYPNVANVTSPSRTRPPSGVTSPSRTRPPSGAGLLVISPRVSSGALVTLRAPRHGDEIDQLLDPAEQLGLELGAARDRPQVRPAMGAHLSRPPD